MNSYIELINTAVSMFEDEKERLQMLECFRKHLEWSIIGLKCVKGLSYELDLKTEKSLEVALVQYSLLTNNDSGVVVTNVKK